MFCQSLRPELNPANRASSREGVHLGAVAATIDVLQRRYLGLRFEPDGILLEPAQPAALDRVRLVFNYRGGSFQIETAKERLTLRAAPNNEAITTVRYAKETRRLPPGRELVFGSANISA